MEKYEGLILEVICITDEDIITTSGNRGDVSTPMVHRHYEDEEEE